MQLMQLMQIRKDIVPSQNQIDAIKQRKMSETGNLESQLKLKIGPQVILTSIVDNDDRLINGLVGKVKQIKYKNSEFSVAYLRFNDNNAGREAMQSDMIARQHNWVPIKKHQALFGLRKNKQQPPVIRAHCNGDI